MFGKEIFKITYRELVSLVHKNFFLEKSVGSRIRDLAVNKDNRMNKHSITMPVDIDVFINRVLIYKSPLT